MCACACACFCISLFSNFSFRYFTGVLHQIKIFNQLTKEVKGKLEKSHIPISPSTLVMRLNLFICLFKFLKMRYVYAGLKYNDMKAVELRIEEMKKQLKVIIKI